MTFYVFQKMSFRTLNSYPSFSTRSTFVSLHSQKPPVVVDSWRTVNTNRPPVVSVSNLFQVPAHLVLTRTCVGSVSITIWSNLKLQKEQSWTFCSLQLQFIPTAFNRPQCCLCFCLFLITVSSATTMFVVVIFDSELPPWWMFCFPSLPT